MEDKDQKIYYMVVDEKSTGPYSLEEVLRHPSLRLETLVWKPGTDNWQPAGNFPEIASAMMAEEGLKTERPEFHRNPYYDTEQPPRKEYPYGSQGRYEPQSPYGSYGSPRYDQQPSQHRDPYSTYNDPYYNGGYQNGYRPRMHTNWLPWAIVATILGLFCSCIGAIFGIIGIVQANKANTLYAQNLEREGDNANSNAKIMTIIGLCLAGLGVFVALTFGNFFSYY